MTRSYLSFYEDETLHPEEAGPLDLLLTRSQILERVVEEKQYDLVVIGAGISGTLLAQLAALAELRVLLLSDDLVGPKHHEEIWRDALIAGLSRYPLRLLAGVTEMRRTMKVLGFPYLWEIAELGAEITGRWQHLAYKVLCRLLMRPKAARGVGAPEGVPVLRTGLVARELGLAARQEGARVLSGIRDLYLEAEGDTACYRVGFLDSVSQERFEVRAGAIALAPTVDQLPRTRLGSVVTKGQGACIGKTRCVEERLGVFFMQQRGPWDAPRCCREIVEQILQAGARHLQVNRRKGSGVLAQRRLAGYDIGGQLARFDDLADKNGISSKTIGLCIRRWAGRVRYIERCDRGFEEICPGVLRGEVELAIKSDHAASVAEIVRGSLALEEMVGWESGITPIALVAREFGVA